MFGQTMFSLPKNRIKTYRHRRQSLSFWQVLSFLSEYIGKQFYYIGATAEREFRNSLRALRRGFRAFAIGFRRVSSSVTQAVRDQLYSVWSDLRGPFVKINNGRKLQKRFEKKLGESNLDEESRKAYMEQFRQRYREDVGRSVARFGNLVLPLVALAGMIVVVNAVLGLQYGLRINVDNKTIGFVANENDFNNAKRIIDNRIINVDDTGYWTSDAVYLLSVVDPDNISTQDQLADSLLKASGSEITEGTGLYVGGVFLGATTDGDALRSKLDGLIETNLAQVSNIQNVTVKFTRNIETVDGIYPTSSVKDISYFTDMIDSSGSPNLYYTVKEGDNAIDIAGLNGITYDDLQALNPDVDLANLTAGTSLLLAEGENLFSVRTLVTRVYTKIIPYNTTTLPDARYKVGYLNVLTEGVDGEQTITEEIEYKNGREVSRNVVSTEVTKESVNQTIVVGVMTDSGATTDAVGTGKLTWPTGTYQFISRGWIPGVHYGLDVAAARGTYIFAADNGVVQTVHTYNDYGNFVMINHNNGMQTAYAHCLAILVNEGDVVQKGQLIALVGTTGRSTGYHLHFEVRINGQKVDPEPWVSGSIYESTGDGTSSGDAGSLEDTN